MRGDSIRDFYAKTLALLGLGVLAGTGALVDYWPSSSVSLPVADAALMLPDVARSMPVPTSDFSPVLHAAAWTSRPSSRPAPARTPALEIQTSTDDVSFGQPVALNELAARPASFTLAPLSASGGREVSFIEPSQPEPIATMAMLTEPTATMAVDDDRDGFLTGAVKRTGTSIARTSVKTGSSIWDALRAVPGFVRKVLPN